MISDTAHVLYVDYQGHPAPLSCSYHATASRMLSSSLQRSPPCTMTEIDSAYCPQCLSFHDVLSAGNLGGKCPRAQCKRCPLCTAVASVFPDSSEQICFYKCGYCPWTSKECNITTELVPAEDGSLLGKEQIARAIEDLGQALYKRITDLNKDADEHYHHMVVSYEKEFAEEDRRQQQGYVASSVGPTRRSNFGSGPEGAWSIQALEENMKAKGIKAKEDATATVGGRPLLQIDLADKAEEIIDLEGISMDSIYLQATITSLTPRSRSDFYPLPIPLRSRKSRRCRAELKEGRPGILVKPKLNPLEGDSSLRSGHGQWWKKDSSAVHAIPRVQVIRHGSDKDGQRHAFLLRVKNPTLGKVNIRFHRSNYAGEKEWDGETITELLDDLLVDTLTAKIIDAKLDTNAGKTLASTNIVELESVEDAFLELGKAQTKEPAEVTRWDSSLALKDSKVGNSDGNIPSIMRLIAKQSDSAWFELLCIDDLKKDEGIYSAVPISLQIQVGGGSWESSLVKALPVKADEPDFVSFDIVVTWAKNGT